MFRFAHRACYKPNKLVNHLLKTTNKAYKPTIVKCDLQPLLIRPHLNKPELNQFQSYHTSSLNTMSDNRFSIDYATTGRAACKKCKEKLGKGELRIAKITPSPFNDDGEMKNYHHPSCMFETFKKCRATTKVIEDPGDLEGWGEIEGPDKETVKKLIAELEEVKKSSPAKKAKGTPKKAVTPKKTTTPKKPADVKPPKEKKVQKEESMEEEASSTSKAARTRVNPDHKDNNFREFRRLCAGIADIPGYLDKSALIGKYLSKGTSKDKFEGDLHLWVRLLLPGVVKRVYNMQSKQMVKVFSRIFGTCEEEMVEDLSEGDVAETVGKFFEQSKKLVAPKKSDLTLHDVDDYLQELTKLTRDDEQQEQLAKVARRCTVNDLKMFIRLMKGDLRIQAGAKHILDGVHPDAYEAFNTTRNIVAVIDKVLEVRSGPNPKAALQLGASLMQPVQPMLAQACKSVEMAFQKCPNGIFSEIKYDGERVQLHKRGKEFKYFSRSLKPVMAHKVKHFAEHIPAAFPTGADLILDAEVLMVDVKTGNPLPFGTLGIHKGGGFKDAVPCLFVFDCLFYNGENWMEKPIKERRQLLESLIKDVGHNVKLSELTKVSRKSQLVEQIKTVLEQGLEGLVIKDAMSTYEPGKRHWLKVKKDYLNEGAMADSADLVVLGGWSGTGKKGGGISSFLMGCKDKVSGKWCTVTKVAMGFDDATLERLNRELVPGMDRIGGDWDRVPAWMKVTRQMVPEFLTREPSTSVVWEVTGAEFSKAELHTAGGISIRFPRVTKMRDDKTPETATNLEELRHLYTESKKNIDLEITGGSDDDSTDKSTDSKEKKRKQESRKPDHASPAKKVKVEEVNFDIGEVKKMKTEKVDSKKVGGFKLSEVTGDLFSAPSSHSLAHCVSQDCKLGKGIAKQFRDRFDRVDEIKEQGVEVGGVAVLGQGDRFIYNLVTKEKYYQKPSLKSLTRCLEAMGKHAREAGVTRVAMPKIGCGLDLLDWQEVRKVLEKVFGQTGVQITVYTIGGDGQAGGDIKSFFPKKEEVKKGDSEKKKEDTRDDEKKKKGSKRKAASQEKTEVGFDFVTSKPLPEVFPGVLALLREEVKDQDNLKRYLVAYGGRLAKSHQRSEATHVVYPEGGRKEGVLAASHVSCQWLVDSIKLKERQEEKLYRVK